MERPFPAYAGDASYVFVCYAHADQSVVYPELVWLDDTGLNIWYDEGITPGTEWSDEIADAITGCETFLYLISPQSIGSEHCRRELNYAMSHGVKVQAVHLEPTAVERGLELSLGNRQAILKHELSGARYREKLIQALAPGTVLPAIDTHPSARWRPIALATAVGLVLILVGAWWLDGPMSTPEPAISDKTVITLRPVRDLSVPPAPRFAAGLTDETLATLKKVSDWQPHLTSEEKGETTTAEGYVVESSVRLQEDAVRLSVNIKSAESDEVLSSLTTDDLRQEDLRSQQRLSMAIGSFTYTTVEAARLRSETFVRTGSYEAMDLVAGARSRMPINAEACVQAIRIDPELAEAHLCIATVLMLDPDPAFVAQGFGVLSEAQTLDPDNAELFVLRSLVPLQKTKDYPEAERLLLRARDIDPFSTNMLNSLGWLLFITGRVDEAFNTYLRIMPLIRTRDLFTSITAGYQFGLIAWTAGRHEAFIRETDFENPFMAQFHRLTRAQSYAELDDPRAGPLVQESNLRWADLRPREKGRVALALQRIGRFDEAAERYAEVSALAQGGEMFQPDDAPTWLAWGLTHYAIAAGDFDAAFRWLELGRSNDPDFVLLVASLAYTRNPRYATLREDPRFDEVFAQSREPHQMHEK